MNSHNLRVCLLSMLTGIALKMPENDIWTLAEAAWLHDIGKLVTPLGVMNKGSQFCFVHMSLMILTYVNYVA